MPHEQKILVVDDVDFFRQVMCDYLRRTPVDLLTAASAKEALDLARRQRPDLIYMDVDMPECSGLEACRQLKADPLLSGIPVILIYTPERDAQPEEIAASGCDASLAKPFGKEEFLNLGHRYLFHIERRERRVPCQMTIDFEIRGHSYQGRGYDLSHHGLYIEFRDELPPERDVQLRFMLPTVSAKTIQTRGRIAWINQGFPRENLKIPQGFGVEFTPLSEEALGIVQAYIDRY